MKKGYPPLWLSALILALLLFWKMLGAPVSAKQFQALETPFWQARVLLPSRLSRVLLLWMPVQTVKPEAVTLPEDGMDTDDRELARLMDGGGESPMIAVYVAEEDRLVSMTLEGYGRSTGRLPYGGAEGTGGRGANAGDLSDAKRRLSAS